MISTVHIDMITEFLKYVLHLCLQPDALNLDTTRPSYGGLDDTFTPTMEGLHF